MPSYTTILLVVGTCWITLVSAGSKRITDMIYHYKIRYQVHKWLEEEEIKSNTIITISTIHDINCLCFLISPACHNFDCLHKSTIVSKLGYIPTFCDKIAFAEKEIQ